MNPILPYETEQRLRAALAAAANDGLRTPDRVEKALVAELRRRKRRTIITQFAVAGALAAAVLIGLFLTRPAAQVESPLAARVPAEVSAPAPLVPPPPPAVVKTVLKRPRPAKPVEQRRASAEPSEFIPLGPWQAMEPMERGSIIRVRLPKSSLPGFGIPVSPDRWNESIPADVVLGEDGSMRAVRFINTRQ